MRLAPLLLVVALVGLPACSQNGAPATSPKVIIDTADRGAFDALRAFQLSEEAAYHAKLPWPTPAQHQSINVKVSRAYQLIVDVATIGIDLPPGNTLTVADLDVIAQLSTIVADIVALTRSGAAANLQTAAVTAQTKVAVLTTAVKGTP